MMSAFIYREVRNKHNCSKLIGDSIVSISVEILSENVLKVDIIKV